MCVGGQTRILLLVAVSAMFYYLPTTCYLLSYFCLFYTYKLTHSKIKSTVMVGDSPDRTICDVCHGLGEMVK